MKRLRFSWPLNWLDTQGSSAKVPLAESQPFSGRGLKPHCAIGFCQQGVAKASVFWANLGENTSKLRLSKYPLANYEKRTPSTIFDLYDIPSKTRYLQILRGQMCHTFMQENLSSLKGTMHQHSTEVGYSCNQPSVVTQTLHYTKTT